MAILTPAEYPEIRAVIDVDLSANDLPDSTIDMLIYARAADQDVLDRDSLAESRTGEAANSVKRAAIYFCAARLCPAVVRLTSLKIQTRDLDYQKATFDPEERAAELREMADEELSYTAASKLGQFGVFNAS